MISQAKLKTFIRHACIISKKQKDREDARLELQRQLQKLKRFAVRKDEMENEIAELNKKVTSLLQKEAALFSVEQKENALSKILVKNVSDNQDKINEMYLLISKLETKMDEWLKVKSDREKSIEKLESRISERPMLRAKIRQLEQRYRRMKSKNPALESRITHLKSKLS